MKTFFQKFTPSDNAMSWVRSLLGIALPLVGAPAAFALWAEMQKAEDPGESLNMKVPLGFTVAVIATILGIILAAHEQHSKLSAIEEADRRRSQTVTRFTDELGATLDVLIAYGRSDGQRGASNKLISDVLREGRRLYAHNGVRLCVYTLEDVVIEESEESRTASEQEPAPKIEYFLKLRDYDGRRDTPRSQFDTGEHAQSLIGIACGNKAVAVPDPANPPEGIKVDHSEHSGWSSYLAVPLIRERKHLGVLLIDTREPTVFRDEDKSIAWTIAQLLVQGMRATQLEASRVHDQVTELRRRLGIAVGRPISPGSRERIRETPDHHADTQRDAQEGGARDGQHP